MKIKLYKLRELKQMNAPGMEEDLVYGILRKYYRQLSRCPRKVIYDTGASYITEKRGFAIPYEYVKEITECKPTMK